MTYKYFSTQRPVSPGTFPKGDNSPIEIFNYDERTSVENDTLLAWGYLIYKNPLTRQQMDDYELKEALHE